MMRYSCFYSRVLTISALVLVSCACAHGQASSSPAVTCGSLAQLALPNTSITMAQAYASGEFEIPKQGAGGPGGPGGPPAPQSTPAFCRVAATLKPTSDSNIKIEVWLPASGWSGKLVGVANMGWGGSIPYRNMVDPLARGYAAAATDTGHEGGNGAFIIGHPEKLIDYAYRADHEMTVKAKAIVTAFYGTGPKRSFWIGCSLGGYQALAEAKRYPEDYDGIVAGAPINPVTRFNASQIWPAWLTNQHPEAAISPAKFNLIHEAALKACATPIGLKQGFIDDPANCHFDPGILRCKGDEAVDCLTAAQVELIRQIYAGPVNPRTKQSIFPGVAPGAELEYARGLSQPPGVAVDLYKYAVFQDPAWDWKTMDYDAATEKAFQVVDPLMLIDPDLTAFIKHGGKLMLYIGWTEGHNANDLAKFYQSVQKNAGAGQQDSVRLFLNPGMNHCGGGAGCDTFEKLGVIDAWVQSGKAPEQVLSSKVVGGKTVRTRPLCAYPLVARYKGTGSEDDASSFKCAK